MKVTEYQPTEQDKINNLHFVTANKCFKSEKYLIFLIEGEKYKHLKITRVDKKPIHNCLDMQEIKNRVLGNNTVAIEVYPAKKEFVNGSNTYHLWNWEGMRDIPNLKNMRRYH
jgi:hypothetical protein